jgi:hypothetical protein
MPWNDVIKDVLNLIIQKVLIGLKWQEFVEPVVDFDPPGMKLANLLVNRLGEGTCGSAYMFSV